jgi:transposase
MNTKRKLNPQDVKVAKLDSLKQLNLNAAGLDIGASEIYACVPEGRSEEAVKVFPTFTADLQALARWLKSCAVTTVAMESTGVYWIPIFQILESEGFEVYLVNARHIKNVSGKKTDILDCQWIQQLHTYGLLSASFRPDDQTCALRSLLRHREMLIHYRASHIQHLQKALQQMNIQLTNVLSDITGVTGMRIIRDIITGKHNPQELAQHRDWRCAKSQEEITKSLEGDYRPEHIFVLAQALELYDTYSHKIAFCEQEVERYLVQFRPLVDATEYPLPPDSRPKVKRTEQKGALRLQLYQMAGVDLTQVEGLDVASVQTILSEVGTDMSRWTTAKHFASWLGLCPHNDITGGKVIRTKTKKTNNRANLALRQAAASLKRSHSALGVFYRRMRAKLGTPKAIVATAHKLSRIIYQMLKFHSPYQPQTPEQADEHYRQRVLRQLQHRAEHFGAKLVLLEPLKGVVS